MADSSEYQRMGDLSAPSSPSKKIERSQERAQSPARGRKPSVIVDAEPIGLAGGD